MTFGGLGVGALMTMPTACMVHGAGEPQTADAMRVYPMKRLIVCVIAALTVSCTDAPGARKALAGAGYTNIVIGGYDVWGCSKDDTYATKFTATGPSGASVRGVVCAGILTGATIRTY